MIRVQTRLRQHNGGIVTGILKDFTVRLMPGVGFEGIEQHCPTEVSVMMEMI